MPDSPTINDLIREVLNSPVILNINFGVPDWEFPETGSSTTTYSQRRHTHRNIYRVYPQGYRTIARTFPVQDSVRASPVRVGISDFRPADIHETHPTPLNPGMMMYMPHFNTLIMHSSFSRATELTLEQKALVVHECTHILNDYNRITGGHRYIDETMAYVAQYLYRFHATEGNPPAFPFNANAQYHSIANSIAMRMFVEPTNALVAYNELLDMKNALLNAVNPDGSQDYANVNNAMHYDGL